MTIATNRPDGWPQATMVGYVNDGYLLYCFIARNTQKYANIQRDSRISVAIGNDAVDPMQIKGLSLAGRAYEVSDPVEYAEIGKLRLKRYPEYAKLPRAGSEHDPAARIAVDPPRSNIVLLRIAPDVISVLDYSKGFGHSDLVTFSSRDLDVHLRTVRHSWYGGIEAPTVTSKAAPPAADGGRH